MSLDVFIDQQLDGDAGGEQDPGGEGDHAEHRGGETFPGEVDISFLNNNEMQVV